METVAVENNIAYLLRQMNKNEKAIELFEQVIEKRKIKLGIEPSWFQSLSQS